MKLFRGQRIISDQVGQGELAVVWRELERVLAAGVPGDVVEFGCYIGTTSLFMRRLLDETGQSNARQLHVYDSFAGLPQKSAQDASPAGTQFTAGALSVSKKALLHEFYSAGLQPPIVHKGWFNELTERDVPPRICFAFLDGDFYDSILWPLTLVWPRLQAGGIILVDDYGRDALPGAQRAVDEFFRNKHVKLQVENNVAIIRPTRYYQG